MFSKLEDVENALRNEGSCRLLVTAYGQLQAKLTQVELYRLRLSAIEENLPLICFLAIPAQTVLLSFPIGDRTSPIWGAITPRHGEFMTFGPGHRMHARTHGPCRWGAIWLPAGDLAAHFHALTEHVLAIPAGAHLWRPRQAPGRRLLQLHAAAIRAADVRPNTIVNAEAARGMEQQLIEAVVECLSAAPTDTITPAIGSHQELVAQFEEFLQAQPGRRLRSKELSAAIGVSERLLRICCNEFLGMSPTNYVRLRALHTVYRILRDGDATKLTISQIARSHGFHELGRFAAVYRSLFGELPSVTLGRGLHHQLLPLQKWDSMGPRELFET